MDFENLKQAPKDIKVLGTGCSKCKTLEKAVQEVVESLNLHATVEKVEDIQEIMNYGVMTTPALVIDGKVVLKGKVPSLKKLQEIITH